MDQCNDISSSSDPNQGGNGGTKRTSSATVPPQKEMPNSNGSSINCAIPNCGKITDELKLASLHALTYYGFGIRKEIKIKICLGCLSKADKSLNDSVSAIFKGECMFNANQKPQYDPDVIDLCSDEEMDDASYVSAANDQTNANIHKHDVPELVKQSLTRFDIKRQVEACTQQANEIADDMDQLEELLNQADDQLLDTLKRYNQFVEPRSEEVDISADGSIRRSNLLKTSDGNVTKTGDVFKPEHDPSKLSQGANEGAANSHEEWIYRGSPLFPPINNALQCNENSSSRPRHNDAQYKNRNDPTVDFEVTERKTARKSTSKAQVFLISNLTENHINMGDPDLCIEYKGSISKLEIPEHVAKSKKRGQHKCNSECVIEFTTLKDFGKCSPLAIPLFLGWNRELTGSRRPTVIYRTPCGKIIKDYDKLYAYLDETNSNLFVDFFCFEYEVNHLTQFVPVRIFSNINDISYGKEPRPIHCVNSVDYDQLPFMDYTPYRVAGEGVPIFTDKEFLACCDCTDNCQNKTKCACWKRTKEGISFIDNHSNSDGVPYVGYENRRLRNQIVTGIYECNSKCRCKSTCSNRVVQNGIVWPLQVFKTTKKGWGVRAMCDMPEGTFISIYSGQVLSEALADKDGIENGDEYLAELDYIETVENMKKDYESDVTDIEADDCEDREEHAGSRSKRGNENPDLDVEMDTHEANTSFVSNVKVSKQTRSFPTRSTSGQKKVTSSDKNGDVLTARTASHFNAQLKPSEKEERLTLRMLYGPDEKCFVIDAKSKGNVGRYFNHSCNPNMFVQNVFVDSHDLRIPLVSFFTYTFVKAGTELTWNYCYQIGDVPGKTMHCYCEDSNCKGRIL